MTIIATFIIIIITNINIIVVVPKLRIKNVASDVAGSPAVPLRHNIRAGMRIMYNKYEKNHEKNELCFFNCFDIIKNSPFTYFVRS